MFKSYLHNVIGLGRSYSIIMNNTISKVSVLYLAITKFEKILYMGNMEKLLVNYVQYIIHIF